MAYNVTVKIEGEKEDQTQSFETKDEVKAAIQQLNGMKSMATKKYSFTITDDDGNEYMPSDFGLAGPKKYESKIANGVDRVIQSEGQREDFEWLLETVASGNYDAWDIKEALDEVFGEWQREVYTMHDAVLEVSDEEKEKDKGLVPTIVTSSDEEETDTKVEEEDEDDLLSILKKKKEKVNA